jgi:hypothetical protein
MSEVVQDFQSLLDYGVGFPPLQIGDEADPAPVFFKLRIVESLPFRKPWDVHHIILFTVQWIVIRPNLVREASHVRAEHVVTIVNEIEWSRYWIGYSSVKNQGHVAGPSS